MKAWVDEETKLSVYEPDNTYEWLTLIRAISLDYNGCNTVESLKELVDDIVDMSARARECLRKNRLFPSEDCEEKTNNKIKFKITKLDKEMFFLKIGNIIYVDYDKERVYSEDEEQYMPLDTALKFGLDGKRV